MKTAYQIIRKPVITEKGVGIKENQNTLVFQVAPKATKTEIKEAVQSIFKVKVRSVRTANYPGKERRRGKFAGYRPDWKKAYVRLRSGEKMPEYAEFVGTVRRSWYVIGPLGFARGRRRTAKAEVQRRGTLRAKS